MSRKYLQVPSFVSKSERTINTLKHCDSSVLGSIKGHEEFSVDIF